MSSHGSRRRRNYRTVDAGDLKKPTLAPFQPRKGVELPLPEVAAPAPVPAVDRVVAAREAAEKIAFDRSKMVRLPTLKERPLSREARQRNRERKARARRNGIVKTIIVPFSIILTLVLVGAISWITYTRREKVVEAPGGVEGGAKYVDDYPAVRQQNDAVWKEKRERLLATEAEGKGVPAGERNVEAELEEREVARRKRELLGVEAPFSEVFSKDKK